MNDVMFVEVLDPSHYLSHEEATIRLRQVKIIGSNPFKQLSTVQVLHHQDNFTGGLKSINEPGNRKDK